MDQKLICLPMKESCVQSRLSRITPFRQFPLRRGQPISQFQELLFIVTITPLFLRAGSFVLALVDQLVIKLAEIVEGAEVIRAVSFHV